MSWLVRETYEDPIKLLRKELKNDSIIKMPGAHDAMSALLAQKVGFTSIYLSGAAFTASLGMPDLGIITLTELSNRTKEITRASGMPMLVDADTGYGGVLNTARTVQELVDSGAAAIQLEDQELPKKCGHLNGKKIVTKDEMVSKILAARQADPNVVIVARTDVFGTGGMDEAVARAKAYYEAGADVIFPEALQTKDDFKIFASKVDFPLLANMTEFGRTPMFTAEEFKEMGYKIIIYPVTSLRIAAKAIESLYKELYENGTQKKLLDKMQTRQELYDILLYDKYEDLDNSIAKTNMDELIKY